LPDNPNDGKYFSEDWGQLDMTVDDSKLAMWVGDMPIQVFASGRDSFTVWLHPAMQGKGRFIVDGKKVVGVELELNDQKLRFQSIPAQSSIPAPNE
jgi:hypothetical protein